MGFTGRDVTREEMESLKRLRDRAGGSWVRKEGAEVWRRRRRAGAVRTGDEDFVVYRDSFEHRFERGVPELLPPRGPPRLGPPMRHRLHCSAPRLTHGRARLARLTDWAGCLGAAAPKGPAGDVGSHAPRQRADDER